MLKNLFGYLLGFFLIFLVLELISRVVFPQFTSGQISAPISKNEFISKGIRQHFLDKRRVSKKNFNNHSSDFDDIKILFLGDSVTARYGVSYENTYYKILERNLSNLGLKNQSEAMGIYGGTTKDYLESISKNLDFLTSYDLIIYQFNLNDISEFSSTETIEKNSSLIKRIIYQTANFRYKYLNHSVFFRVSQHYAGIFARNTSGSCEERSFDALGPYTFTFGSKGHEIKSEELWENFKEAFKDLLKNFDNKKLIVFISPISLYLKNENLNNHINLDLNCATIDPFKNLSLLAEELEIEIINTIPYFIEYSENVGREGNEVDLFFEYDTNHPNSIGHYLISEILQEPVLNILKKIK